MTDTQRLLSDYVNRGSEPAFRELVARYIDLVYSTAIRLVRDDAHLAEDITQTVFIDLAYAAVKLSAEVRLGGWLHRHTCFVSAKTLRAERRRKTREREALELNEQMDHTESNWDEVAPILDEAVNQLRSKDRTAILLRFYERLEFGLVGEALGISEAAAQKRVSRALEKLHLALNHRGVNLSLAALGVVLSTGVIAAAPAALYITAPTTAVANAATLASARLSLFKLMGAAKTNAVMVTALLIISLAPPLFVSYRAAIDRSRLDTLSVKQADQIADITAANQRFQGILSRNAISENKLSEVMRLRSEANILMTEVRKLNFVLSGEDPLATMKKGYAMQVDRLKQWFEANPSEKIPEMRNLPEGVWINAVDHLEVDNDFAGAARMLRANAEQETTSTLWLALRSYASNNGGKFPKNISELKPYFKSPIEDDVIQRYEIVPARNLVNELQPGGEWAITQKKPVNADLDLRVAFDLTEMRSADERVTNRWTFIP